MQGSPAKGSKSISELYSESNSITQRILSQYVTGATNIYEDLVMEKTEGEGEVYTDIDALERKIHKMIDAHLPLKESVPIKTEVANLAMFVHWVKVRLDSSIKHERQHQLSYSSYLHSVISYISHHSPFI